MRSESCLLLLLVLIVTSVSVDPSKEYAKDLIGSAINGYAAIIDRIGKIYQILTNSNEYDNKQQEFFQRNRRKIEREILKNTNEEEIMNEILNEYDILPIHKQKQTAQTSKTDDYSIPIIDDIFGFNRDNEEEQQLHINMDPQNNPQFEYIRRRLREEHHEDIVCNNSNTNTYDTDYKFKFASFPNCSVTQRNYTMLNTTDIITIINTTNIAILYSSNCEFMLMLNEESKSLQIMASQQIVPWWSSSDDVIPSNTSLSMQFNSNNGHLNVYDGNGMIWAATNTSNWNNDEEIAPYRLVLSDTLGKLYIIDGNEEIKWYSEKNNNHKVNFRENVYTVNLTDTNHGDTLYSMPMAVVLILHAEQEFELYFEYILPMNTTDTDKEYISIMNNMLYKFNVSVYELSSHSLGDRYIVYDASLPMIYSLIAKNAKKLSITESHTFLCIDDARKYFNVEIVPFNYNIALDNYTLLMSPQINDSSNYTFFIDPWNPCNEGRSVLAQKASRQCFVSFDIDSVVSLYDAYSSNAAYSNVNMKYIFGSSASECIHTLNNTLNITFPANFSIELCSNYITQNGTKNWYFNSSYCSVLHQYCGDNGYYDICLDFTESLCTCYCPRDKKGTHCDEFRDYDCKLNILNANMTECDLMTQQELNAHGRDDYDVTLDGDKPCFFVDDDDEGLIESVVQLHCYFMDTESHSKVWEELSDYVIYSDNITFDYCLGNETSTFALSSAPPKSTLRLKLFNFARIFSDNETYIIPLDINHWSGDRYIYHNKYMKDLDNDYKIGGRIYIEYQLWQNEDRINVERRFYDIDHWVIPPSTDPRFNASQKWFIVIVCCTIISLCVYCIAQCNKWCKNLEHEKND